MFERKKYKEKVLISESTSYFDSPEKGDTGPQGETGPQGPQGEKGDTGETPGITVVESAKVAESSLSVIAMSMTMICALFVVITVVVVFLVQKTRKHIAQEYAYHNPAKEHECTNLDSFGTRGFHGYSRSVYKVKMIIFVVVFFFGALPVEEVL